MVTSNILTSTTTLEETFTTGFNYTDCLAVVDPVTLKTGSGEPFNGLVQYLTFSDRTQAKNAVVSGSFIDKFIDSYFDNRKLNKLVIAKVGSYFPELNQVEPATAGAMYKDTVNNFIMNEETKAKFYFVVCDLPVSLSTEMTNMIQYFHDNASMIKKRFVFEEYVATGIPVYDIIHTDAPTTGLINNIRYLVGVGTKTAGDPFEGKANKIATYIGGGNWSFYTPINGDVIKLLDSTDTTYNTHVKFQKGKYIIYNSAISSPTVAGFLWDSYVYSFTESDFVVKKYINDNNYINTSCVANVKKSQSLMGAIVSYSLSLELNNMIANKTLTGIDEKFLITSEMINEMEVLKNLKVLSYYVDTVGGGSILSTEDSLNSLHYSRDINYTINQYEQEILQIQKEKAGKITYNESGRERVRSLIYASLEKTRALYSFIGNQITQDEIVANITTAYKSEGYLSPYYIYPSKISEKPNYKTDALMEVVVLFTYVIGVEKFIINNIIKVSTNS